jgi:AcrR family transcriptional regulator
MIFMSDSTSEDPSESDDKKDLRQELIESASRRLRGGGVDDFSVSAIAEECDTSRQMIYTFFGGKSGLLKAVYDAKAEELKERFEQIEAGSPLERWYESGQVYRDFMLEHASLFDTVFSLEASEKYKGPDELIERVETHDYFESIVQDVIDAGYLPPDTDPTTVTNVLWGAVNGMIQLELLGYYPDQETAHEHYDDMIISVINGKTDRDIEELVTEFLGD